LTSAVGIVVNPHAGKDIRRLVAGATVTSDATKVSIARRVAVAALEAGSDRVLVAPDRAHLARRAVAGLDAEVLAMPLAGDASDTVRGVRAMRACGVGAVVVLGGDGTCRDVVRAWRDVPLLALSSGTNNVFPQWTEGTVMGLAAGLVASGRVPLERVGATAKLVHLRDAAGHRDVALVDAVLVEGSFTGSRAMWEPERLRMALCSRAEPAATGVSAIAGLLAPCGADDPGGVVVTMAPGAELRLTVALAPGLLCDVGIVDWRRVGEGEPVKVCGPGLVALDGERHHVLGAGHEVELWVERDGPFVVDPQAVLRMAAEAGLFTRTGSDGH
jgi:predicted polyphosphate/ATP-dependent NAD kinase